VLTFGADLVFGARCRVTEGADFLETLLVERLTAARFVLFPEENVADFLGVLVLACLVTALPLFEFPCLTAVPVLFLAELVSVVLRTLVADVFRVAAEFCLTEEFVLFLLLLAVADLRSALFLRVTALLLLLCAEDFTAARVPTLFSVLVRDLRTAVELFVLDLLVDELLTAEEFLPELFRA
jgi:hypothetical protein